MHVSCKKSCGKCSSSAKGEKPAGGQWIEDAGLECADLFDAWDDDRSGTLRKKEWLAHFRNLTRESNLPGELWYAKLRALS